MDNIEHSKGLSRVISSFTGDERGPLIIGVGGLHGNEHAGLQALDFLVKMIEVEPITNPDFNFRGRVVGIRGNLAAIEKGVRYIDRDLNRSWLPEIIDRVMSSPHNILKNEDMEIYEIIKFIWHEIETYQPEEIILIDLHTTTAFGGIFTIPTLDSKSMDIALGLDAPVITGFLQHIPGNLASYVHEDNFHVPITAVVFESGQHNEPLSVNRAIAALINCIRDVGMIDEREVENQHLSILKEFSANLPKISKLLYKHKISKGDEFTMKAGFQNFQQVTKGEILAHDKRGEIYSPFDGLLLMPLYQHQGEDGFFIIEEVIAQDERINDLEKLI